MQLLVFFIESPHSWLANVAAVGTFFDQSCSGFYRTCICPVFFLLLLGKYKFPAAFSGVKCVPRVCGCVKEFSQITVQLLFGFAASWSQPSVSPLKLNQTIKCHRSTVDCSLPSPQSKLISISCSHGKESRLFQSYYFSIKLVDMTFSFFREALTFLATFVSS